MILVTSKISLAELEQMSKRMYGDLVKAVVDIDKKIMVVDADMHADQELFLLETGSQQEHLWGINLHVHKAGIPEFIEFNSMINLRPSSGNRSRSVENPVIKKTIHTIVHSLVNP